MLLQQGDTGKGTQLLQERLQQAGFLKSREDGFGAATTLAVREFQRQQGLGADGVVGPRTWSRLFPVLKPSREYLDGVLYGGRPVYDDLDDVVAAVAANEWGTFDALQLNGDGQGLSFGILQWAQRPGSLYELLANCHSANAAKFTEIWGDGDAGLAGDLLAGTRAGGKKLALWQGPWPLRFWLGGRELEFQRVQRRLARQQLAARLEEGYRLYPAGFKPQGRIALRALVMLADVGNQAGPGGLRRALKYAGGNNIPGEAGFIRALGQYVESLISRKYGDPNYGNTRGRHEAICQRYSLDRVDWPALRAGLDH
jgi:hypothetical protein